MGGSQAEGRGLTLFADSSPHAKTQKVTSLMMMYLTVRGLVIFLHSSLLVCPSIEIGFDLRPQLRSVGSGKGIPRKQGGFQTI
jgi:hypothetical protein